jgi:hypothetical protein
VPIPHPIVVGEFPLKGRRAAHTAAHDLWAQDPGSEAMRALLTTLPCHWTSGRSQPWCTISRRMGTFAEMVLAVAHENEEIVPASVSAILCGNVEHPWENSSQHERRNT